MNAPVTATPPAAPAAAASEGKPGRKVAEAAVSGDFAAVLAAVAGMAAPPVPAHETPAPPETPVGPDGEREGHGAEVITPPAAGDVSGPFPAGIRPGATVTLPDQAAHAAPVRGNAPAAAPEAPPAVPLPVTPEVGAPPADAPAVDAPALEAPPVAPPVDAALTSETTTTVDATTAGHGTPAEAASPRAHVAAGWAEGPVPRPETRTPHRPDSVTQKVERRPSEGETRTHMVAAPVVVAATQAAAPVSSPTSVGTPAPAAAPAVVEQVVEVIQPLIRMEDGSDEVVLELRPADLGRVRVEVRVEHGVVHATLHADQDTTADLLRQSLPDLRTALVDAGLQPGDLGCGHGRSAGQGGASQDRPAWGRDPDRRPGTPAEPALTHRAADPRRSLDVLL